MATERRRPLQLHVQHGEERKISWLELFYDLIYVATIIQLGDLLSSEVSPLGALLFVLLFVPVWWSWTGVMFYFNRFVADDLLHRLLIFAQMFAVATMAISVTGAFGERSSAFALAYFSVRIILVLLYLRAWRHIVPARPLIGRYAVGFALAASLWLVSAFVPPPFRFVLWIAGLAIEFYVPLSSGSRKIQSLLPPDGPHLSERYGLFTIIVLGESFIKVVSGLGEHGMSFDSLVFSGLGFVIAVSLWWMYFDNVQGATLRRIAAAPYLWIYTHLPMTIGIIAVGVGLKKLALLEFGKPLPDEYRWLITAAVALCLLAFALLDSLRERERPLGWATHALRGLPAVVIVLLIGLLGGGLPELVVVLAIALVCVGQAALISSATTAPLHLTDAGPGGPDAA